MKFIRQRRGAASPLSRRTRAVITGAAVLAIAATGGGIASASTLGFGNTLVGTLAKAGLQISSDQVLNPLGDRLLTPFGKIMGSTVSPNSRFLAATSMDRSVALQIFDLSTGKPVAAAGTTSAAAFTASATKAGFPDLGANYLKIGDGSVGEEGPVFSPDGAFLFAPVATGLVRYPFDAKTGQLSAGTKISIPTADAKNALTGAMAFGPDGTLYAAVNGQNTVVAIANPTSTAVTPAVTGTWNVGIAPRGLQFAGSTLYVSNEGGRPAVAGDATMNSYGTQVPADTEKGTSTTGTLSVIDTKNAAATPTSISVGLHPGRMLLSGSTLYVSNTNSDTVSVVDTATNAVVQTIDTQPWSGSTVGYAPNGMAIVDNHLVVALGGVNALGVYALGSSALDPVRSIGLIPTDYYPENVFSVGGKVVVSNRRGNDTAGSTATHATTASLTSFTMPDDGAIRGTNTDAVFRQNGWTNTDVQQSAGNRAAHIPAVPVPAKIGDPSTIKHVFMIVKENRTYDQVYGDIAKGNGDASLAQYGQQVTPNQHALANQFGLYDNIYNTGTNSAEGHNWLMQGDNPDYTQATAGEYIRSYDTEEDVLGHQRSGFLWTAIKDAGKTAKNFGEFIYTEGKPPVTAAKTTAPTNDGVGTWQRYYCATTAVVGGTADPSTLTAPEFAGKYSSQIPSLAAITNPLSPPFDLSIPDVYREQIWKQDFEKNGPADFNMIWFSNDHTGGSAAAAAQVADNDLAVGRMVDEISHSKYWADSAIFVVEDDSQAGADHVDGHRAPVQVISPWAQHGQVVDTYYTQISMDRTIEQILGAQPLNEKIAAATPMVDAFTTTPDNTPFTVVPNQTSLTLGTNPTPSCGADVPSGMTPAAAAAAADKYLAVPPSQKHVAAAWKDWIAKQPLMGNEAKADSAAPAAMNRFDWYDSHNYNVPYPGDKKVLTPDEVPGANDASTDADG